MTLITIFVYWAAHFIIPQRQPCEFYISEDYEILALCTDSVIYRLKNEGGMSTYSYAVGTYKKKKSKKILINHTYYPFADLQVSKATSGTNDTRIVILDSDSRPVAYAPINLNIDKVSFSFYTDSLGSLEIKEMPSFSGDVSVELNHLGNTFLYKTRLEKGMTNTITSKIPNRFGINNHRDLNRKYLKTKYRPASGILSIYDPLVKSWKTFYKKNVNLSFKEAVSYLFKSEPP